MAEPAEILVWAPRGPWHTVLSAGRVGRQTGAPGLVVEPRGCDLVSVIACAGEPDRLAARFSSLFGIVPPSTPRIVRGGEFDLIWSGRDQWLARAAAPGLMARLGAITEVAAVADQSDARAILRLSGPRVREVLAKGCMIDLHPRGFGSGDVALTSIAHIGVHLWQLDDEPTYEVAVFRSLAGSFWSWLSASAAEFGCEVRLHP